MSKDRKVNKSNVGDFVWAIEDVTRRYCPRKRSASPSCTHAWRRILGG